MQQQHKHQKEQHHDADVPSDDFDQYDKIDPDHYQQPHVEDLVYDLHMAKGLEYFARSCRPGPATLDDHVTALTAGPGQAFRFQPAEMRRYGEELVRLAKRKCGEMEDDCPPHVVSSGQS